MKRGNNNAKVRVVKIDEVDDLLKVMFKHIVIQLVIAAILIALYH